LFYRRRGFQAGLPTQARAWRRRRTAFYVFCPLQRFDTAKTLSQHRTLDVFLSNTRERLRAVVTFALDVFSPEKGMDDALPDLLTHDISA
jgi:hypothetical protein